MARHGAFCRFLLAERGKRTSGKRVSAVFSGANLFGGRLSGSFAARSIGVRGFCPFSNRWTKRQASGITHQSGGIRSRDLPGFQIHDKCQR